MPTALDAGRKISNGSFVKLNRQYVRTIGIARALDLRERREQVRRHDRRRVALEQPPVGTPRLGRILVELPADREEQLRRLADDLIRPVHGEEQRHEDDREHRELHGARRAAERLDQPLPRARARPIGGRAANRRRVAPLRAVFALSPRHRYCHSHTSRPSSAGADGRSTSTTTSNSVLEPRRRSMPSSFSMRALARRIVDVGHAQAVARRASPTRQPSTAPSEIAHAESSAHASTTTRSSSSATASVKPNGTPRCGAEIDGRDARDARLRRAAVEPAHELVAARRSTIAFAAHAAPRAHRCRDERA